MKILCFGSCNIDYFYDVPHMVRPGETLSSETLTISNGGKGLNQSIALAKAGGDVYHAGLIGPDGQRLLDALKEHGVKVPYVGEVATPSGHAIIQRSNDGENAIVLFKGANHEISRSFIDEVLANFEAGDILLLQNEINEIAYLIEQATARGLAVAMNPAPFAKEILQLPLEKLTYLIVNEIEGQELSGESEPDAILNRLTTDYKNTHIILTLGAEGVVYGYEECRQSFDAIQVEAIDTTAAGDTFIGYFLSGVASGLNIEESLKLGIKASSITVTRKGSSESIPRRSELD